MRKLSTQLLNKFSIFSKAPHEIKAIYKWLTVSNSHNDDSHGAEYMLKVILLGAFGLGCVAFCASAVHQVSVKGNAESGSPYLSLLFCLSVSFLYWVSRRFSYKIAGHLLIGLFTLAGSYAVYRWSIDVPIGLLIFGLVIFMSGILISSFFAVVVTVIVAAILAVIGALQSSGVIHPDIRWTHNPVEFGDAITFVALFVIISLISLLSNREISKSLKKLLISEASLLDERNNLEAKVMQRTFQLERLQKERLKQLQRFADFGRISAGLVHDIANPLTVASLRLEQLNDSENSKLLEEAIKSIHWLEKYTNAARRQLQSQSVSEHFRIDKEISDVIDLIEHKARKDKVELKSNIQIEVHLFGDPCKFNQVIANLIANAIDAYIPFSLGERKKRLVLVTASKSDKEVILAVQDWGTGIGKIEMNKIFEPFYGTMRSGGKSLGIGLSMVKQIVQEDFNGSIEAFSSKQAGTSFVLRLPI